MRRVAYMTPLYFDEASYLGGGERYPLNLAKAVTIGGEYEVDIVACGDEPLIRQIQEGVRLRVLPAAARPAGTERLSWEIIQATREVDIVHLHQMFSRVAEVAFLAAKVLGRPVCATDHGGGGSHLGRSLGMLDLVDRIIGQSQFAASLIRGQTQAPIELVRGGADDSFFVPPPPGTVRDHFLFVGRLLPHKGVDRLIVALPPGVPLTVCGRSYDDNYAKLLRTLARGKQVEFVTAATDETLRTLYQRARAVVLPSVYVDCYGKSHPRPELIGLTLLEGMACGAPAICSRVGGMPEYVADGETGFVFDDLGSLTEHLVRLSDDPSLVATMGDAARRRVEGEYGLEAAGRAMRAVYDTLDSRPDRHEDPRHHEPVSA